jgi:hypothetical protein
MTTPYDPYATSTSALPAATASQIPGNALGLNSATINTSDMNVSSSGGGVIAGYSGDPGAGNLAFSLSVVSGTDAFGNTINTGINAIAGNLQGTSIVGAQIDSTTTLQGTQVNSPQVLTPTISGGTAAALTQTITNTNGGVLGYSAGSTSATYSTNGNYLWTCPTGITSVNVQCWGAGAGGGGGSSAQGGESGGGGEYAQEASFAVTPGNVYSLIVGQGGSGGGTGQPGGGGSQTVFQSQSGGGSSVTANGGTAGINFVGGQGGSGSSNSVHFNGGNGANASGNTGGAGGAGSAGPGSNGNGGNQSVSSTGALGGAGFTEAGAGGTGGNTLSNGSNGSSPGGAGGGAGSNTVTNNQTTYPAADPGGTYSYRGSDASQSPNALINHDGPLYQGYPGGGYGTQYSYWILPWAQIQSDTSGATITGVSIKQKCLYSYFSGGVYARMWYTNLDSFGSTGNALSGSPVFVKQISYTQNETLTESVGLNGSIGTALQSGAAKSMMFYSLGYTPGGDYYGSWDSGANNGVVPALIVNYGTPGSTAGNGSDGQIILTYGSNSTPTFTLSVSALTSADTFGNPYNAGFTGNQVTILGSQAPSTTPTQISNTSATSAAIAASTAGQVITTNTAGFTGQMPSNQTDVTLNAVTQTVATGLSKSYTIPAGDPQVGTLYRITCWGDIHSPASAGGQLTWQLNMGGSEVVHITLGAANLTASTFYEWYLTSQFQYVATGSGGTGVSYMNVNMGQFSAIMQYGNGGTTVPTGGAFAQGASGFGISTLAASSIQILGSYSSSVAAQTVRCFGSMLERLGP